MLKKILYWIYVLVAIQMLVFITWFNIINYQTHKQVNNPPNLPIEAPDLIREGVQEEFEERVGEEG